MIDLSDVFKDYTIIKKEDFSRVLEKVDLSEILKITICNTKVEEIKDLYIFPNLQSFVC